MGSVVPLRQDRDTEALPAWVQLLKPRTAAQAEAARRYVEHLRAIHNIERRDDLAPPYRATPRFHLTPVGVYAAPLGSWAHRIDVEVTHD